MQCIAITPHNGSRPGLDRFLPHSRLHPPKSSCGRTSLIALLLNNGSPSSLAIMISQIVHAEHKKPLSIFLPGRLPDAYSILAEASVRIYHAQLSPKNAEWSYSRLRGTLVLGKDIPQAGDLPSVEAESYWFRLLDADSRKPVWMFKIPTGFAYQLDRPFFHIFQGRVSPIFLHSGPPLEKLYF